MDIHDEYTDEEKICGKCELHKLLDEGIECCKSGEGRPAEEVFADIKKKFGFVTQ